MDPVHRVDLAASISGPAPWPRRGPELRPLMHQGGLGHRQGLPAMEGRFDGVAVRGPVVVGSLSDVVFVLDRDTTPEEVNDVLRQEATSERYQSVLGVAESHWSRPTSSRTPRLDRAAGPDPGWSAAASSR
jgi:hypothetical protein